MSQHRSPPPGGGPGGGPTGKSLQVNPVDSEGQNLTGALVNGSNEFTGSPTEISLPDSFGTGDSVQIQVEHFGRIVFDKSVSFASLELIDAGSDEKIYTFEPECQSFYPQQFNGLKEAKWLGDRLALAWDPPRERPGPGVEVSLATTKENLFADGQQANLAGQTVTAATDSSGETIAYTFESEDTHLEVPNRGFMGSSFYAAARLQGQTRGESQVLEVAGYSSPSLPNGTDVTGVSINPSSKTIVGGDAVVVTTTIFGSGDPNPRVSFSTSGGAEIIQSSQTKALVTADSNGTVTATSEEDGSFSAELSITTKPFTEQVGRPPAPSGVEVSTFGPNGTALLRWDSPEPDIGTRVDVFDRNDIEDTLKDQLPVENISNDTQARLKHIGPDGKLSSDSVSVDIPKSVANGNNDNPTALRVDPFPELVVPPGGSQSIDLSTYVKIAGSGSQTDRWSNADVETDVIGGVFSASASGATVTVSAPSSADSTSGRRDLVLVRIKNDNRDHTFITISATRGSSSGTNPTNSIAGVPASWANLADEVDATRLVGDSPEVYSETNWEPVFGQKATAPDPTLEEDILSLSYDPSHDGRAAVLALKGDDGVSTLTFTDDGRPHHASKNLPLGQIDKLERRGTWVSYSDGLLQPGANPSQWKRVLQNGALYDVSLFEPPREVYYSSPLYFDDLWIDKHKYPDDATLDFESGTVVYRGGLESPSANEVDPTVDQLSVDPVVGGLDVNWSVSANGNDLTGAVEVTVTPDGESSFTTAGNGTVQLRSLDRKPHTIEVLSTSETATPRRSEKTVTLTAWRAPDLSYTYRYATDASPDTFVDGFDTEHSSPSFPIEVSANKSVDVQQLQFQWSSGETQRVKADVQWRAPKTAIETEKEVRIGANLPAGQVPQPTFTASQYGSSRTVNLATNVYPPGELRVEPEGFLPPGIDGEIEDYVTLTIVRPDGTKVGSEATLKTHTELQVRATIEASEGQSPVLYGARAIHRQTS